MTLTEAVRLTTCSRIVVADPAPLTAAPRTNEETAGIVDDVWELAAVLVGLHGVHGVDYSCLASG